MKKVFFTVLLAAGFLITAEAQKIADNAIGLRIGDNKGFGTEINYQRGIGGNNRLEFGLGWRTAKNYDGFKLNGLYQWVWNIDSEFNWYAGAGGGLGSISWNNDLFSDRGREAFVFATGTVGIEYNFEIPLILSLDLRPEISFGRYRDDLGFDLGLGIRYHF